MAKIKYEFLAQYYARNGTPLRAKFFANAETLNKVGSAFAPLSNWMLNLAPVRKLNEAILGVDARRRLPPFAAQTFTAWFSKRSSGNGTGSKPQVALFADCFMNWNYPEVGRAAVAVLEACGYEVVLAEKTCCQRPAISKGMLEDARAGAEKNVALLARYADEKIPVVGCEPSCLLTLRDDYLDLVKGDKVEKVASNAWLVDELLVAQAKAGKLVSPFRDKVKRALLHGHCHQKAHIGSAPSIAALELIPGCQVAEINSGCCGMAGSFGFEKEHYDISEKIGRERLFPAVDGADAETAIVVTGVSCRQQIGHFTTRQPRHVVEVLADALG